MNREMIYHLKKEGKIKRWYLNHVIYKNSTPTDYGIARPHIHAHRMDRLGPLGTGIIIGSEGRECFYWKECTAKVYEIDPNIALVDANIRISKNKNFTVEHWDNFCEEQIDWLKITVNAKTKNWIAKHWDWICEQNLLMFFEGKYTLPLDWDFDSDHIKLIRRTEQWPNIQRRKRRREIVEDKPFINI